VGQAKGRGKGGGRGRVQCSNCDKFGHRDKDCTRPPWYSPPPTKAEEEVQIKTIWGSDAKGFTKASFRDRYPVPCTLDATNRRNMIDPALVHQAAVEPIDEDELLYGKPNPTTIGQYCAVFRIEETLLVTTVVDVVPGTEGVTLGSDWLNNNVSRWNLNTGKVDTYDGSFHTRMERDVRMIRTSDKKKSGKKKEPDQVLMGTPIYAARLRRVAAGLQAPALPPEITELSKLDEYLELPPAAWSMDYPLELEKYQESDEYLPISPAPIPSKSAETLVPPRLAVPTIPAVPAMPMVPPVPSVPLAPTVPPVPPTPESTRQMSSAGRPTASSTVSSAGQTGNQAHAGIPSDVEPRFAGSSTSGSEPSSPICALPRTPPPAGPRVNPLNTSRVNPPDKDRVNPPTSGRVNPSDRPRDSKSCKPSASPTAGCLPAVTAENPTVSGVRVENSPPVHRWVTVVSDSSQGATTSSSTGSIIILLR